MGKNKKLLLFSAIVSLVGVAVCAVSTAAWFELDQTTPTSIVNTADPSINISDYTGYKVNNSLNEYGFPSGTGEAQSITADSYQVQTQDQQGEIDTAFDIPDFGVGYYLVKENDNGTFKFTRGNHTLFNNYNSTNYNYSGNRTSVPTRAYIESYTITEETSFRVRNYFFYSGKTEIDQIDIKQCTASAGVTVSVDTKSYDVTVSTPGIYKVWLDYSKDAISNSDHDPRSRLYFEKTGDVVPNNPSLYQNNKAPNVTRAAGDGAGVYIRGSCSSWDSNLPEWEFKKSEFNDDVSVIKDKAITATTNIKLFSDNWWGTFTFVNKSGANYSTETTYGSLQLNINTSGTYTFVLSKTHGILYMTKSSESATVKGTFDTWGSGITMSWDSTNSRYYKDNYQINKDTEIKICLYGMFYGYNNLKSSCSAYAHFSENTSEDDGNIKCSGVDTSDYYDIRAVIRVDSSGYIQIDIYIDTAQRHTNNSYILRGDHNSWAFTGSYGMTVKNANTGNEEHYKNNVYLANGKKFIISRYGGSPTDDIGWDRRDTTSMGGALGTYLAKDGTSQNFIVNNSIGVAFDIFYKPSNNSSKPNTIFFNLSTYTVTLNLGTAASAFGKTLNYTSGYTAPSSYTFGTACTLPVQENMRLGDNQYEYEFEGWYTNESCTGTRQYTIAAGQHENKTYYAKWSKVPSPTDPTIKLKLYDPDGYLGSTPVVYAWGVDYQVYERNHIYSMTSEVDSSSNRTYWTTTISSSYGHFLFSKDVNFTEESVDYTTPASSPDYFYVVTSNPDGNKVGITKYKALSDQTNMYTFYYFDNRNDKWTHPSVYAWNSDALSGSSETLVPGTTDVYKMYEPHNGNWPGVSMIQLTPEEGSTKNVDYNFAWKIEVSISFDSLIFNDGTGGTANESQTTNVTNISDFDTQFFVINKNQPGGRRVGSWHATIYAVEYYASYFLDGVHQSDELMGGIVDYTFGDEAFTPNQSGASIDDYRNVILASEATIYKYQQVKDNSSTVYYSSNTCTSEDIVDGTTSIGVSDDDPPVGKIYIKYEASTEDHVTFLIDASVSGNFNNNAYHKWNNIRISDKSDPYKDFFTLNVENTIAPDLYQVTLPESFEFRVSNNLDNRGGYDGNNNFSTVANTASMGDAKLLNINSWYGANCPATWHTLNTFEYGTATIHIIDSDGVEVKYLNGEIDQEHGTAGIRMENGNGTVNKFVYEHGLIVPRDSKIYIDWNSSIYDYDDYFETPPAYITHQGTSGDAYNYITPQFSDDHMRFNFYIHSSDKIVMTMVPERGNGYYLVPYNSSYGVDSYINAKQMASGSPLYASYSGLNITDASSEHPVKFCIRSFIEGKDALYKNISSKPASVTMGDGSQGHDPVGVISFTANGYFDIVVQNGMISISEYVQDTSFTLNPLDLTQIDNASAILTQRTSLVIEVQFTCNNPYASTISVDLSAEPYIGASLYVTNTPLANPYSFMREYCYMDNLGNSYLNNASAVNLNNNFVIPANSSATYFAYILLDYLPLNGTNYDKFIETYHSTIICYLRSDQY